MNNQDKDVQLTRQEVNYKCWNDKVEKTPCPICKDKQLVVDVSMTLIQCEGCGICFEYRYNRGVIPYHTIISTVREIILQEDEYAPDARAYFIKEMSEKYSLEYTEFFHHPDRKIVNVDDLCTQYHYKGYVLEFNGDYPYYLLYRS